MNYCGIDVSYKTLDVVLIIKGKALKVRTFDNQATDHKKLLSYLKKHKIQRVGIESTGYYHLDIALLIQASQSIQIMLINPRASHNFAKAMMQGNKTDAIDAKMLAHFVERMDFTPWIAPQKAILELRACGRRLVSLSKDKAKAKNQLHAFTTTKSCPNVIIKDIKLSIKQLESQINNMTQYALTLVAEKPILKKQYELLTSIKGLGEKTAIKIIGELGVLSEDMQAKQWVAHAGLYPRVLQSGSSLNKQIGIGKSGNRYIREALYMSALSASRWEPSIRDYYQHLINDNGLKKMQALCAVMRKMLVAIHQMLKHNKTFDGERFYMSPPTEKRKAA